MGSLGAQVRSGYRIIYFVASYKEILLYIYIFHTRVPPSPSTPPAHHRFFFVFLDRWFFPGFFSRRHSPIAAPLPSPSPKDSTFRRRCRRLRRHSFSAPLLPSPDTGSTHSSLLPPSLSCAIRRPNLHPLPLDPVPALHLASEEERRQVRALGFGAELASAARSIGDPRGGPYSRQCQAG